MTTLLERLRHETRPLHEQTESLFYTEALQNGTLSADEYTHLLRTHLFFHQQLEAAIDQHPDFFQEYAPEPRRKTAWLQADLAKGRGHVAEGAGLGVDDYSPSAPRPLPKSFRDWSPIALLGAAYVGEGSMLGGTVIWRLLQKNPAVQPLLTHARFFQGYGPATGSYWKSFGVFLTEKGEPHADDVVAAAKQAFSHYQIIFKANQ